MHIHIELATESGIIFTTKMILKAV